VFVQNYHLNLIVLAIAKITAGGISANRHVAISYRYQNVWSRGSSALSLYKSQQLFVCYTHCHFTMSHSLFKQVDTD